MKFDLRQFGEYELADGKLKSDLTVAFDFIRKRFLNRWEKLSPETQDIITQASDNTKLIKVGKNEQEIHEFLAFIANELENNIKHMDTFYSGELNKYLRQSSERSSIDVTEDKKKIKELINSIDDFRMRNMWEEEMAKHFKPAVLEELIKLKVNFADELKNGKFISAFKVMEKAIDLARDMDEGKKYNDIFNGFYDIIADKINSELVKTLSPITEENFKIWITILWDQTKFLEKLQFNYMRSHKTKILESILLIEDKIIEEIKKQDSNFTHKRFEDKKATIVAELIKAEQLAQANQ